MQTWGRCHLLWWCSAVILHPLCRRATYLADSFLQYYRVPPTALMQASITMLREAVHKYGDKLKMTSENAKASGL